MDRPALASLACALLVLACKPAAAPEPAPGDTGEAPAVDTLLIFDAGSSGTRAHVYVPGEGPGGLVDLSPECDDGPPLADGGEAAMEALWPCVVDKLPGDRLAEVPAHVLATAGMRSLAEVDPEAAAAQHEQAAATLRAKGLVDVESRTIAGMEEAHFAWIAANLQLDTLGSEATVGTLELGGSSAQIAFVPDDPAAATETLSVAGRDYPLFAVSYLHCGANDSRRAMADDACFYAGCEDDEACHAAMADTPAADDDRAPGDFPACGERITAAMTENSPGACPADDEARPPMAGHPFILVSSFAYAASGLGAAGEDGSVDPSELWAAATSTCATAWPELGPPAAEVEAQYRASLCFNTALTHELFELYGLDGGEPDLRVLDDSPEWTLAAAYLMREPG